VREYQRVLIIDDSYYNDDILIVTIKWHFNLSSFLLFFNNQLSESIRNKCYFVHIVELIIELIPTFLKDSKQ